MNRYLELARANGLIHASSRKLPLISGSCIFYGYNTLLKKTAGYAYGMIGSFGAGEQSYFLINEDRVGRQFKNKIKFSDLRKINRQLKDRFKDHQSRIIKAQREKNSYKAMTAVLAVYPEVLAQIGFYNSIMRYVKDDFVKAGRFGSLIFLIAKDKDEVANLIYREIEPLIKKSVSRIGPTGNFDGDLLRYSTLSEFKEFLKTGKITKAKLTQLAKRRAGYVYLFHSNQNIIITAKTKVEEFRRYFIRESSKVRTIKGVPAYPGIVRGKVCKSFHGVKNSKDGYILVTNITRPQDTPILKKFSAIVTDEGGVLSHIAVLAREYKIPAVMTTKIATKFLNDGDLVEVDANRGVVRKII